MTKSKIIKSLENVIDPEINIPLLKLNMIGNITINKNTVLLELKLTTSICPLKETLEHSIKNAIKQNFPNAKIQIDNVEMTNEEKTKVIEIVKKEKGISTQNYTKTQSQTKRNKKNLSVDAKNIIGIASGKGGVGKSILSAKLAIELANKGKKVGIMDADIYGYSIPNIFNINKSIEIENNKLIPIKKDNVYLMSMGFLTDDNEGVLLRGPLAHRLLQQFIKDVKWPKLDYLIVDLPPGTGDVAISLSQLLENMKFLVIATPNENVLNVAKRTGFIVRKSKQKIIGVIENMSYLELKDGSKSEIFGKSKGSQLANELSNLLGQKIPLIAKVPILPLLELYSKNNKFNMEIQKILSFL